jgi:hypothetical protein
VIERHLVRCERLQESRQASFGGAGMVVAWVLVGTQVDIEELVGVHGVVARA